MRLGLKDFLIKKFATKQNNKVVGISLGLECVSVCVLEKRDGVVNWLENADFGFQEWKKELPNFVNQHKLAGAKCYLNFTSHYYQLLQVDKPMVSSDEIYDALQWPVKELLDPNEHYVYDYVEFPIQVGGTNKLSVVAVPEKDIDTIARAIFASKLELEKIGTEEVASVRLLSHADEAILTLSQESGEEIVLNIVKGAELFFTRRIKGFENLGGYSTEELKMGLVDNLCVQIQRSMDFYESQLRQAPIREIRLRLDISQQTDLIEMIHSIMSITVSVFEPDIKPYEGLSFKMASYSCLGAAYSHYASALDSSTSGASV